MKIKSWLIILSLLTFILVSGCMENSRELSRESNNSGNSSANFSLATVSGNDILYQVSTIDALLQGVYDGTLSVGELETHGDFGIGTLDGLDGEMLALDGNYYQVKSDGIAYPVSENMTTPFATVTYFEADENLRPEKPMNLTELEQYTDLNLPSENFFYAVRIDGNFSYLKARSVPKQELPYRKLADVVANQTIFEFENVSGTLVGFRAPNYVSSINVPGYHLHFITENRSAGGHVLEFELENGNVALDTTPAFFMELPTSDNFSKVKLGQDLKSEMENVEK
jgi:acetolactate decarboxylase